MTVKCFHEGAQKAKEKAGGESFYHQAPFLKARALLHYAVLLLF